MANDERGISASTVFLSFLAGAAVGAGLALLAGLRDPTRGEPYTDRRNGSAHVDAAAKAETPVAAPPVAKTEAPPVKTEGHAPKAEAPAAKTEAPAPKAEAPVAKTEAPPAPVAKTEAPAAKTEAPAAKTEAPAAKTETPAAETAAPETGAPEKPDHNKDDNK